MQEPIRTGAREPRGQRDATARPALDRVIDRVRGREREDGDRSRRRVGERSLMFRRLMPGR
ncbi:MAG: hypothetical protein ACOCUW_03165 [Gemmatimonadota bacterium]